MYKREDDERVFHACRSGDIDTVLTAICANPDQWYTNK